MNVLWMKNFQFPEDIIHIFILDMLLQKLH